MELSLIAVGRLRPAYRELADEYLKRGRRYWRLDEREVREAGRAPTDPLRRRQEAERLRHLLPESPFAVALARRGESWSSEDLARQLIRWREAGRHPVFVIGGSTGLAPDLLDQAGALWSLGPMTLPHELTRVVVLEQLYRAGTILHRHPYHKGRR